MTIVKVPRDLRDTNKKLAAAVRSARTDIRNVRARSELTEKAKRAAVEARRQELREEVHAIQEAGKAALREVEEKAPAEPSVDPLEAMRIWGRIERRLDAGHDPLTVGQEAVIAEDRQLVTVLLQELPSYLQAKGEQSRTVDAVMNGLRRQEQSLLSPEEAGYLARAKKEVESLQMNGSFVLSDLEGTDQLFDVFDGQHIAITEED